MLDNASRKVRRYGGASGVFMGEFINMSARSAPRSMEYRPDGNFFIVGNGLSGNRAAHFNMSTGELTTDFAKPAAVGIETLKFLSRTEALFTYEMLGGMQGSINLTRLSGDTVYGEQVHNAGGSHD